MTESVIDFPKDSLCPQIWEKVVDSSSINEVWQLKPDVRAVLQNIFEKIVETTKQHFNIIHITGSITSNSYTENADIDMHFLFDQYEVNEARAEEINKMIRTAYKKVFIGKHPIEVYFQPNRFQDMMSVGCYDFFKKKWLVGPEMTDPSFNPYSEYYQEIQAKSEDLAQQIRNTIFSIYEIAVVMKKNIGTQFEDNIKAKLVSKLEAAQKMYDNIRQMRKVYSSPTSAEQALEYRSSRKWKVADGAFKLFDKYGYMAILKQFIEDYKLIHNSHEVDIEIVDDILGTVKNYINNADKLAEKELFEDDNFSHDLKSYFKYWQQSSPKNTYSSIQKELAKNFDRRLIETCGDLDSLASDIITNILIDDDKLAFCEKVVRSLNLEKLINRKLWWDLIPDHVYKAIITREVAVSAGKLSRGVSDKVIYDCLDKICWNTVVLYIQSHRKEFAFVKSNSRFYECLKKEISMFKDDLLYMFPKYNEHDLYTNMINNIFEICYDCCASYLDYTNSQYDSGNTIDEYGHYVRCDTTEEETFENIFKTLDEIKYDDPREKLIAGISKAIDHVHYTGSLAGAFIEGGCKTCDEFRNIIPDVIYESEQLDEGAKEAVSSFALALALLIPGFASAKTAQAAQQTFNASTAEVQKKQNEYINLLKGQDPNKMMNGYKMWQALNILAVTLFGEGRSQIKKGGLDPITDSILNRTAVVPDITRVANICVGRRIGSSFQYSFWNDNKSALETIEKGEPVLPPQIKNNILERRAWEACLNRAVDVMTGNYKVKDTKINSYHVTEMKYPPFWSPLMKHVKYIGDHKYGYVSTNDPRTTDMATMTLVKKTNIAKTKPATQTKSYVVKKGDTFSQIAKSHNKSIDQLKKLNPQIDDASKIRIGQKLNI